jgi:tetrahydrodipicolinate N-acetyltransferase
MGASGIVIGNWDDVRTALEANTHLIEDFYIEKNDRRNSAIDLLDTLTLHAWIEPGAIIREGVTHVKPGEVIS